MRLVLLGGGKARVAKSGPESQRPWGNGQWLLLLEAVLSCRDSQCPCHHCHVLVAATETATTSWAAVLTYLSLIILY